MRAEDVPRGGNGQWWVGRALIPISLFIVLAVVEIVLQLVTVFSGR